MPYPISRLPEILRGAGPSLPPGGRYHDYTKAVMLTMMAFSNKEKVLAMML